MDYIYDELEKRLKTINLLSTQIREKIPTNDPNYSHVVTELFNTFGYHFHSLLKTTYKTMGHSQFVQFVNQNVPQQLAVDCWYKDCNSVYASIEDNNVKSMINYIYKQCVDLITSQIKGFDFDEKFKSLIMTITLFSIIMFKEIQTTDSKVYLSPFNINQTNIDDAKYTAINLAYNQSSSGLSYYPITYGLFLENDIEPIVKAQVFCIVQTEPLKKKRQSINPSSSKKDTTKTSDYSNNIEDANKIYDQIVDQIVPMLVSELMKTVPKTLNKKQMGLILMSKINHLLFSGSFETNIEANQLINEIYKFFDQNHLNSILNISKNVNHWIGEAVSEIKKFNEIVQIIKEKQYVSGIYTPKDTKFDSMTHESQNTIKTDLLIAPGWGGRISTMNSFEVYRKSKVTTTSKSF